MRSTIAIRFAFTTYGLYYYVYVHYNIVYRVFQKHLTILFDK